MKRHTDQIEDAYVGSRRQREEDRSWGRSYSQDRSNRYRDEPEEYLPISDYDYPDSDRDDRYGYEGSMRNGPTYRRRGSYGRRGDNYPDTYRSAASGYMHEYVGDDRGREDYLGRYSEQGEWRGLPGIHRGKGPKNYRRSDERILEDILDRLTDDPWVDASEIDVTVESSEVTLAGVVSDRAQKRRAEDIVEAVSGVTHVENRIRVGAMSE